MTPIKATEKQVINSNDLIELAEKSNNNSNDDEIYQGYKRCKSLELVEAPIKLSQ